MCSAQARASDACRGIDGRLTVILNGSDRPARTAYALDNINKGNTRGLAQCAQ